MEKLQTPCGLHCMKVHDLNVTYGNTKVLENINLHLHCNSLSVIIGKNGAGKSTLIRAILGDVSHTGTIEFKDQENGKDIRLKIGYVPQTINVEANSPISVYDLFVSFHFKFPLFFGKQKKVEEKIRQNLRSFQAENLLHRQLCKLSGGELQRVMMALAIMESPNLLLLDEPVSGVDKKGMDMFYETIADLKNTYDLSIILVSHDLDYVKKYADKVVLLDRNIKVQGSATEVFESQEFLTLFGQMKGAEHGNI